MVEKIKTFDFTNSTGEQVESLISEMVALPTEQLKECLNEVIDTIDMKYTAEDSTEVLPESYKTIFNNDKVKVVLEILLDEYNQKNPVV
jgi:hypothetical protein